MSKQSIYNRLITAGLTPEGAAGLMGNMQCESALLANNAQDGLTPLSDADYTASADAGSIDFVHDAVGYGLCQWTYWSRKQALLDYARSRGLSVGDEDMQVDFCLNELRRQYSGLYNILCSTDDLYNAAGRVCKDYERPAYNNIDDRYKAAQKILAECRNNYTPLACDLSPLEQPFNAGGISTLPKPKHWYSVRLPLLKQGIEHPAVKALQLLLSLPLTGLMDDMTVDAVKHFQTQAGIAIDGDVGGDTWSKLLGV